MLFSIARASRRSSHGKLGSGDSNLFLWAAESELHLGCEAQFSGRWNEAETHFNHILSTNARGSDIYQKAKLRRAVLMVEKGLFPLAKAEFAELLATEPGWERRTYAQHWLLEVDQYEAHAAEIRVCGRDAEMGLDADPSWREGEPGQKP